MRFLIKLLIAALVIAFCTGIGKKLPQLAGLIAVMPLTGLIVLVWLYLDNPGNSVLMADYAKAAVFGIVPTMLFFLACYICFQRRLSLTIALFTGFAVWVIAALVHQWLLK